MVFVQNVLYYVALSTRITRMKPLRRHHIIQWSALSFLLFWMGQAQAFEVKGLKTPDSFITDPATGHYFISNINGKPAQKDNNGFITKLDPTGKVLNLKFVEGGRDGVTLHAPKGLAILHHVLYVTDIDTILGFDKETGALLYSLDLTEFAPVFLNDLTHDSESNLYATDMVVHMILKIETLNGHRASLVVRDEQLQGPNGIVVHPQTGNLIVVTWDTGSILEVTRAGEVRILLDSKGLRRLDGVDLDENGDLYTSSFADGRIYKISPDFKRVRLFREGLTTPADINLDLANRLVLIPFLNANKARTEKIK